MKSTKRWEKEKREKSLKDLEAWAGFLENKIDNDTVADEYYDTVNKLYECNNEIEAKQQFVQTYKKDLEDRKKDKEKTMREIDANIKKKRKELRETKNEGVHQSMKKCVIERFGSWTTDDAKIKDWETANLLIKKYGKVLKPV